jgi:hypothetical protein
LIADRMRRLVGSSHREVDVNANRVLVLAAATALLVGGACQEDEGTSPTLSVTCSANPSSGVAPLTAAYVLSVAGAEGSFTVAINYGDGTSGTDPDARHTYTATGIYTASFSVTTSSQSARCAATVTVTGGGSAPTPTPTNAAPNAVFKTTPAAGAGDRIESVGNLEVRFNMCASRDPEDNPLRFTMDLDGDGQNEVDGRTGGDCRRSWEYHSGTYKPENCVTDLGTNNLPLHDFQCKKWTVVVH